MTTTTTLNIVVVITMKIFSIVLATNSDSSHNANVLQNLAFAIALKQTLEHIRETVREKVVYAYTDRRGCELLRGMQNSLLKLKRSTGPQSTKACLVRQSCTMPTSRMLVVPHVLLQMLAQNMMLCTVRDSDALHSERQLFTNTRHEPNRQNSTQFDTRRMRLLRPLQRHLLHCC